MNRAILSRTESSDHGTFGRVLARGKTFFSGELPWRDNRANISCIPDGIYQFAWTYSPHFKRFLYGAVLVGGRGGIRKHSANFMGDVAQGFKAQLNGCIALGERLGWMEKQKALLLSAPAVRRFEALMERNPFILEVKNDWNF